METWYKVGCPHCDRRNWVCAGDPEDYTASDTEVVECFNCGKKFWLDETFAVDYHGSEVGDGCLYDSWEQCLEDNPYSAKGLERPD